MLASRYYKTERILFILTISLENFTKLTLQESGKHSIFKHLLVDILANSTKPFPWGTAAAPGQPPAVL